MNMRHEEEDELLEEIDVYYNGELNEEIFVLQYPLRPSDKFYGDHAELTNVMIDKDNSNMKCTYSIESKMKNFDTQYYDNKNFTQSLVGQSIDPNTNYCAGVFKNNILYLNPVSNFVQFRNDFSHMEAADAAKKKNKEKIVPMSRRDSVNVNPNNQVNAINPPESNNSHSNSKWANLKFYKKDTIQSYQIYEKLYFDDNIKPSKIEFVSHKEYFDFFFSNVNREIVIDKLGAERTLTYKELMEQPLNCRVEFFMKKLFLVSFLNLKKFCGSENFKNENFLDICLKYGRILKNKYLILKSEIRYDQKSDMCTKRNYIINLLQNSKDGVKKSEIKFLDQNELKEILSEISQSIGGSYFLNEKEESEDLNSIHNFKQIYDRDTAFWDSINFKKNPNTQPSNIIIANIVTKNESNKMIVDDEIKIEKSEEKNNINNNIPTGDISMANGNGTHTSKYNLEFIKNNIKTLFTSSKLECIGYETLIHYLFKQLNIDINSEEDKDLNFSINEAIRTLCYNVNNVCFLKEVGEADASQSRKALIEYLATKKTAKKAEIKTHLQLMGISVPDNLLNRVLKTIGTCTSSLWSLKEPK